MHLYYFSAFHFSRNSGGSYASTQLQYTLNELAGSFQAPISLPESLKVLFLCIYSKTKPVLVVDGLFDYRLIIVLVLKAINPSLRVAIHPRGNAYHFKYNAMSSADLRLSPLLIKRIYKRILSRLISSSQLTYFASSSYEKQCLLESTLKSKHVLILPDHLPICHQQRKYRYRVTIPNASVRRPLKIAFFGGLSNVKNIDFVLNLFLCFPPNLYSHWLFGGMEIIPYQFFELPSSRYKTFECGLKSSSDQIAHYLSESDLVLIPSLSESFCYLAYEAICNNSFVIISDHTPWNFSCFPHLGVQLSLDQPCEWLHYITLRYKSKSIETNLQQQRERSTLLQQMSNTHSPAIITSVLSSFLFNS